MIDKLHIIGRGVDPFFGWGGGGKSKKNVKEESFAIHNGKKGSLFRRFASSLFIKWQEDPYS